MHVNARKEAGLINPDTGDYMELDIFLPQLNLAFEYQVSLINVSLSVQHPDQKKKTKKKKKTTEQERHHYTATDYLFQPLNVIKERDEKKIKLAKEKGITLLPIPCWWNGKRDR